MSAVQLQTGLRLRACRFVVCVTCFTCTSRMTCLQCAANAVCGAFDRTDHRSVAQHRPGCALALAAHDCVQSSLQGTSEARQHREWPLTACMTTMQSLFMTRHAHVGVRQRGLGCSLRFCCKVRWYSPELILRSRAYPAELHLERLLFVVHAMQTARDGQHSSTRPSMIHARLCKRQNCKTS